jgi:hypothetical protein
MQPRVGRRNFFVLIYERVNARGTREDQRTEMRRYSFAKHVSRVRLLPRTTFGSSLSSAISLTVTGASADFAITASPASGSVAAGAFAVSTLTLTPSGGFDATITLSCSGLPADAACSFSPASVALSTAAETSQLTLTTAARVARVISTPRNPLDSLLPAGPLLAGMIAPFALRRRRRGRATATQTARWLGLLPC